MLYCCVVFSVCGILFHMFTRYGISCCIFLCVELHTIFFCRCGLRSVIVEFCVIFFRVWNALCHCVIWWYIFCMWNALWYCGIWCYIFLHVERALVLCNFVLSFLRVEFSLVLWNFVLYFSAFGLRYFWLESKEDSFLWV